MVSSPIQNQTFAMFSIIALKVNQLRLNVLLDYILMSILVLVFGLMLQVDKAVMNRIVSWNWNRFMNFYYHFFYIGKLSDGFECPKAAQTDANGNLVVHPKFAHPTDCQRFYVCLNGQEPRDLGCQVGEVYNEESQRCDAPENVAGWWVNSHQ